MAVQISLIRMLKQNLQVGSGTLRLLTLPCYLSLLEITVVFYLVSTDGKRYRLTIPRLLLNQSSLPPPPGWQNRTVVLRNSQPDDQLKITVSKIEQVVIVD